MLTTCDQCQRHIRETEVECPFCHSASEARRGTGLSTVTAVIVLGAALTLSGCPRLVRTKYGAPPPRAGDPTHQALNPPAAK
jgi:hypothetical protein